ncbi:hypothetical protein CWI82_06655 [Pseudidiomarina tainanensis]|nr:hypothetical protein CWI82_06655 [Pseudidiomarina tainanensis]
MSSANTATAPYINNEHTSTGNWFLSIFLAGIPLVGLILLIVWAFSHSTPLSKRNWARAMLIWMVVALIMFTLVALVGGIGLATMEGY